MAYDPHEAANRVVIKGEWDTLDQLERIVAAALQAAYQAGAHANKKRRAQAAAANAGPRRADLGGPTEGGQPYAR